MRSVVIVFFILTLSQNFLFAQEKKHSRVMPVHPSYVLPVKHTRADSISHTVPQIKYVYQYLKNTHINNPATRYALDNLKRDRYKYYELSRAIRILRDYAENEHIKYMLNYVRTYFETVKAKEEAIAMIQERISRDSLDFYRANPELDSLHLLDSTRYDIFLNQDLEALLAFMEQDENYQWMKERSRDSVLITILGASDRSKNIWLNTGRAEYHRMMTENFVGDSIGGWIKVMPRGKQIKFLLDNDVYQTRRFAFRQEQPEECLLVASDSAYFVLAEMKIGTIERRHWTYYSDVSLSFGQGFISSNWASGGENSLSILSDLKYFATYKKRSTTWENSFRYRLGALKSGSEDLSKNEDKLEIQSKLGVKAFRHWNYATQFDMNTVLFNSYNASDRETVIANFLSPGNFTLSLGLDYKPKDNISLYLSPIAGQWVYVRDTNSVDVTRYGIEAGKRYKSDAGAKIELKNKHTLFKFLNVDNHLMLFSSYYEQPEKLTVDWRLTLNFRINYFMQTSIYANAVYNQNDSKKIQFKETLNIGVHFRF
ncbi:MULTISPECIES: DUF3078 domain-containing protein [Butyricimonas]|uniref:DUF3078 domain-containing protein n=1 Tax=Butyricimonas TaxID=574697 RepID=UPI001E3CDAF7|nr:MULTISPECIES: DUF3078 domain-containing protein [Butyricimonas]